MGNLVEALFLSQNGAILAQKSGIDGDEARDRILVDNLAEHNRPTLTRDGVHGDDAHARGIDVLRSPVVIRAAGNDIPAQVIHRDDLRRNLGLLDDGPQHLPAIVFAHHLEIARVVNGAYGG